jgi:glycyl-tRNA synthetase beta subunit
VEGVLIQTVKETRERKTHISNEISARVVILIENNTVVVVACKLGLRTSKVHVFLEKQGTLDIFASLLAERKNMSLRA